MELKLDILAIGVHPDDVELGCAGTIVNEVRNGKKVGIVDMTQGELGTRGTKDTRKVEAEAAAKILGVSVRENLKMRDGFFMNDEAHKMQMIQIIRKYQPDVILANILEDRHPDHGRAGNLIADAAFLSGLVKIETFDEQGRPQQKWRPKMVLHYLQDWDHEPNIMIDITESMETKMQSILAYTTQFNNTSDYEGVQTYISSPEFLDSVKSRARIFGKKIGVKYAEGFVSQKKIGIRNLDDLILIET